MKRSLIPYFLLSLLLCVPLATLVGWWSFKAFFAADNEALVAQILTAHPGVTSRVEYNDVSLSGPQSSASEVHAAAQVVAATGLRVNEITVANADKTIAAAEAKVEPRVEPKPSDSAKAPPVAPEAVKPVPAPSTAPSPTIVSSAPVPQKPEHAAPAAPQTTIAMAPVPAPPAVPTPTTTVPAPPPSSSSPPPAPAPKLPPSPTIASNTPVAPVVPPAPAAPTPVPTPAPTPVTAPTVPTTKNLTGTIKEGTLELTGPIADEASRQALLSLIKSEAPDAKIVDQLVIVPGSKTPAPSAIGAIAAQMVAASGNRSFVLTDKGFEMSGEVTDALLEKWSPALKSLSSSRIKRGESNWEFSPSVYHFPSRKVGEGLDAAIVGPLVEVLKENNIFFASGRSEYKSDQKEKIAKIIAAVKSVKDNVRFIIGGHADARGDPEYNQIISQERAKTVLEALKAGGVNTDNFSLEAFGPSKIVNGPPESYAASRRVEVLVR